MENQGNKPETAQTTTARIEEATEHAKETLQEKANKAKESLNSAKEKISHKVHEGGERINEAYGKVADTTLNDVTDSIGRYVKDKPGSALLIAGAVGVVAGLLLRSGKQ